MKYIRYRIRTIPEAEDLIACALYELGIEGVEIEDKVALTAAEKEQIYTYDADDPVNDGVAFVSAYLPRTEQGTLLLAEDLEITQEALEASIRDAMAQTAYFAEIGDGTIDVAICDDAEWKDKWKQFFHSFRIDDLLVTPSWEEADARHADDASSGAPRYVLRIDPGTAFGTGAHETTQLAIRALRKEIDVRLAFAGEAAEDAQTGKDGITLLDIGTGSGILSIVALMCGASFATGTDLDPFTAQATKDNLHANAIDAARFHLVIGNLIDDAAVRDEVLLRADTFRKRSAGGASESAPDTKGYDIIVANILPVVLKPLTPVIPKLLAPNGTYICSGILAEKEDEMRKVLAASGFLIREVTRQGEWIAIRAGVDGQSPTACWGGVSMTERDAISFSAMLKRTRKQRGISSADLCAGICTEAMYSMIESGKREMNKTMRDRFLGRMGITTDGFEEYLKGDEYEVWMLRQRILDAVEDGHTGKARMLLKYYQELIDEDDCISRQFVHVVRGWTLHMKNASIRQRCKEYKAALLCTMPDCEPDHLLKLSLSLQEIAILLDYYSCIQGERESLSGEDVCHLIKKVMDYIEQKHFEDLAAAKIYPKAVVLLGDVVDKGGVSSKTASFLPEVCKKAIEMLRNTCRSYYAVEIIKLYLRYTGAGNIEFIMNTESPQRKEQDVTKQYSTWKEALTGIHEDAGLSAHTGSDTYLYRETEVYSIGEVINRRRIMLGMSKKKLADQALCSERTIKRIEDGEVKLQSGVFKDLFRVLGLPPEYSMMEIIAEHAGIIELINELKRYDEENDAAALRVLVKQIQEMAGYNEWNQQYLSFMECRLRYLEGKTNQDAYYHELKDVLGKTVPYERLSGSGYYTSTELLCIYHMAVTRRDNENDPHAEEKLLSEYYDSYKKTIGLRRMVNQYEMHATMLASTKGNRGEFDVSDRMGNDVIRICLSEHRLLQAYANVYNAFWNAREACKKRGGSMSKNLSRINQRRISQCIALSDFCKQTHAKRFYEERQ